MGVNVNVCVVYVFAFHSLFIFISFYFQSCFFFSVACWLADSAAIVRILCDLIVWTTRMGRIILMENRIVIEASTTICLYVFGSGQMWALSILHQIDFYFNIIFICLFSIVANRWGKTSENKFPTIIQHRILFVGLFFSPRLRCKILLDFLLLLLLLLHCIHFIFHVIVCILFLS